MRNTEVPLTRHRVMSLHQLLESPYSAPDRNINLRPKRLGHRQQPWNQCPTSYAQSRAIVLHAKARVVTVTAPLRGPESPSSRSKVVVHRFCVPNSRLRLRFDHHGCLDSVEV